MGGFGFWYLVQRAKKVRAHGVHVGCMPRPISSVRLAFGLSHAFFFWWGILCAIFFVGVLIAFFLNVLGFCGTRVVFIGQIPATPQN